MEAEFFRFMKNIDLEQFSQMLKSDWGKDTSYINILYLFIIGHKDKTTVSELSEDLNLSRPAVTQKVNELESLDLIKKTQLESDKRYFELSLSDKVIKTSETSRVNTVLDHVRDSHSNDELEVFTSVLKTMADYLEREDD